ncbi:hypothetical protein GGR35_002267 [Mucilaginibacter phyllosphaerae]|uniref:Uncharacterized protein n=1 Tax=Mucilaginibacter phyllosphaerae TaxID=1812349 RepID=A0ABR6I9C8_9SPHI|nr:hypothetical protein [Mucilaginibacter phyllosphaerae]
MNKFNTLIISNLFISNVQGLSYAMLNLDQWGGAVI